MTREDLAIETLGTQSNGWNTNPLLNLIKLLPRFIPRAIRRLAYLLIKLPPRVSAALVQREENQVPLNHQR